MNNPYMTKKHAELAELHDAYGKHELYPVCSVMQYGRYVIIYVCRCRGLMAVSMKLDKDRPLPEKMSRVRLVDRGIVIDWADVILKAISQRKDLMAAWWRLPYFDDYSRHVFDAEKKYNIPRSCHGETNRDGDRPVSEDME